MGAALAAGDILDELDYDAQKHAAFFPDFDHGYHYHVDARLSAYGDGKRWAVVIEQLAVNPRAGGLGGVRTEVYYHGPSVTLPPQPGWGDHPVQSILVIENGNGEPLLSSDSIQDINLSATDVSIRGQVVPIRTDANYYWARAIETNTLTHEKINEMIEAVRRHLDSEAADIQVEWYETELRPKVGRFGLSTWHVIRGLVPDYRDLLLATESERRRGLPADLPLLLQLDDWEHPRLLEGELPSGSESFRQIARVIAARDPSFYKGAEGNVHWRNWPNAGSL